MKKDLGVQPAIYPMPVLMIATYNDDDSVDVMNMAWGGICAHDMVALNISRGHKTTKNIEQRGAFTLSIADVAHLDESDYFGIASGNKVADKFERTGMTATNSVRVRTGNVSAGTSVFSMIVTEKPLSKAYEEIDMVTTPTGEPVAMVHCNNCTSDLNAWVDLFKETLDLFGVDVPMNDLYGKLYNKALEGDADCGGLLAYNYFSGEHVTGFEEGRPLFVRKPDAAFTLSNFMRTHLYTSLGALKTGMDILLKEEKVAIDRITGHGGLFKTKGVGQSILAAACNTPIAVMETAGEGGAWGMAILANYMISGEKLPLDVYLEQEVFADAACEIEEPKEKMVAGFEAFMENYKAGLAVERAAVDHLW